MAADAYAEHHMEFFETVLSEAVNTCINTCAADPLACLIDHLQTLQKQQKQQQQQQQQRQKRQPHSMLQAQAPTRNQESSRRQRGSDHLLAACGYRDKRLRLAVSDAPHAVSIALGSAPSNPRTWRLQVAHIDAELSTRSAHYLIGDSEPLAFGWAQRLGANANPERALMPSQLLRVGRSQQGGSGSEGEQRRRDEKRALTHLEMVLHLFDSSGALKPPQGPDGNTLAVTLSEAKIVDDRFVGRGRNSTDGGSLAGFELNWTKKSMLPQTLRRWLHREEMQTAEDEAPAVSLVEAEQLLQQAITHKAQCEERLRAADMLSTGSSRTEQAASALDGLNVSNLREFKGLNRPPAGADDVAAACVCLLQTKEMPFDEIDTSWGAAKRCMGDPRKFLEGMVGLKQLVDEERLPKSNFANIQHLLKLEHFAVDIIRKKSDTAASLADYVINLNIYNELQEPLRPLRHAADAASKALEAAIATKNAAIVAGATARRASYSALYDTRIVAACEGAAQQAAHTRAKIAADGVGEIRALKRPPPTAQRVFEAVALMLGDAAVEQALGPGAPSPKPSDESAVWDALKASLLTSAKLRDRLETFSVASLPEATVRRMERAPYSPDTLSVEAASRCSSLAAEVLVWAHASLAHHAALTQRDALVRLKQSHLEALPGRSPSRPPVGSLAAVVVEALAQLRSVAVQGASTQSSSDEAWDCALPWVCSPRFLRDLIALNVHSLDHETCEKLQAVRTHPDASNAAAVAPATGSTLDPEALCALVDWLTATTRRRLFASAPSSFEEEFTALAVPIETLVAEYDAAMIDAFQDLVCALEAIRNGWKQHVSELKSLRCPPEGIELVFSAVAVLLHVTPDMETAHNGVMHTWSATKKLLLDSELLQKITTFDKDAITLDMLAKLEPMMQQPDFTPEEMTKTCVGLRLFAAWTRGLFKYSKTFYRHAAKRAKVEALRAQFEALVFEEDKDKRTAVVPRPPMDFTDAHLELRSWGMLRPTCTVGIKSEHCGDQADDEATPAQERIYRRRRRLYGSASCEGGFASVPDDERRKNAEARHAWEWLTLPEAAKKLPAPQRMLPWLRPEDSPATRMPATPYPTRRRRDDLGVEHDVPTRFGAADRARDREAAAAILEARAAKAAAKGWVVLPSNHSWGPPGWRGGSTWLGEVAGEWVLQPAAWKAREVAQAAERKARQAAASQAAAAARQAAEEQEAAAKAKEVEKAKAGGGGRLAGLLQMSMEGAVEGGGETPEQGEYDEVESDPEEAEEPAEGTKGQEDAETGGWTAEGWMESLGVIDMGRSNLLRAAPYSRFRSTADAPSLSIV